jgi:hypothetical protein
MTKVGILLKSTICSRYFYKTIKDLADSNKIELFFLINSSAKIDITLYTKILLMIKKRGLIGFLSYALFKIFTILEFKVLSIYLKDIKGHYDSRTLDEFIDNNLLYLNPIFSKSGLFVYYPSEDIDNIKSLKLDLILRGNADGIFKGDILSSSKGGILSFHHGDNRWNRGGPAGFWEVYYKKASTGFIIQILSEELDGGRVVFRSNIATKRSYSENISFLYSESYPFMSKVVLDYATNGSFPIIEEQIPYSGSILKTPTPLEIFTYQIKISYIFLAYFIKRFLLHRRDRWSVSFIKKDWNATSLRKGKEIKNPKNRFFADPFIVTRDGRTVCFVEDYSYKTKIGSISAIEIFDKGRYKILDYVIKEPFHISFPYLFEYKDELYVVPETSEAKSIRLYKCIEFPMKWEYQKDLFRDINATDTMIFYHNNLWWMMFSLSNTGKNYNSQLVAYYTKSDPINGEWTPHKQNPLINDSSISRNGGVMGLGSGKIVRGRQKQGFNIYGASLTLAKIIELTPSSFREKEICQIEPNFYHNIRGCHHFHSNGEYSVYDYFRNERLE